MRLQLIDQIAEADVFVLIGVFEGDTWNGRRSRLPRSE